MERAPLALIASAILAVSVIGAGCGGADTAVPVSTRAASTAPAPTGSCAEAARAIADASGNPIAFEEGAARALTACETPEDLKAGLLAAWGDNTQGADDTTFAALIPQICEAARRAGADPASSRLCS